VPPGNPLLTPLRTGRYPLTLPVNALSGGPSTPTL